MAKHLSWAAVLGVSLFGWAALVGAAEDSTEKIGWNNTLTAGLNVNQALFDNWSQGGDDALNWQLNSQGIFNLNRPRSGWLNQFKIAFGMSQQNGADSTKTADEIRLSSVYTYKLTPVVKPFAAFRVETQFTAGYELQNGISTEVSNFFDPGYLTESAGFEYSPAPVFSTRLGFAVRQTLARRFAARYTDQSGTSQVEEVKIDPGMEWVSNLNWAVWEKVTLTSELNAFTNFAGISATIVRWDNVLTAAIAPYLNTNLNVQIYYDKSFSTRRQLKEALSLGLAYSFL